MKILKIHKGWGLALLILAAVTVAALWPSPPQPPIRFVDRQSGLLKTERVAGEKWLVWLYNNPVGEATLWALVKRRALSEFYGNRMDRPASAEKIEPFAQEFSIDLRESQKQSFSSFNDFFTRKLKDGTRPVDTGAAVAVSPADGKILAYESIANRDFIIKGYRFNVNSFLDNASLAQKFRDGILVIIRLAPPDYHRFHFPVSGALSPVSRIDGDYYSVNPLAIGKMAEIFCLNKREYTVISSPLFGGVVMAEVGATMVGSIIQTYPGNLAEKGEEKGYFKFGGSTVVLLFEKDKIRIDSDLLTNTAKGFETAVRMGEKIGISLPVKMRSNF